MSIQTNTYVKTTRECVAHCVSDPYTDPLILPSGEIMPAEKTPGSNNVVVLSDDKEFLLQNYQYRLLSPIELMNLKPKKETLESSSDF